MRLVNYLFGRNLFISALPFGVSLNDSRMNSRICASVFVFEISRGNVWLLNIITNIVASRGAPWCVGVILSRHVYNEWMINVERERRSVDLVIILCNQ